jgi:rhamnogalacturonyl hydrolase YesR
MTYHACLAHAPWMIVLLAAVADGADSTLTAPELKKQLGNGQLILSPVGVANRGTTIDAILHRENLRYKGDKTRVLLVGRSSWESRAIGEALLWYYRDADAAPFRDKFLLSAVPTLFPDPGNSATSQFPPQGTAYHGTNEAGPTYLWRWIGMHAPDLVVDVQELSESQTWHIPEMKYEGRDRLRAALHPSATGREDELATALVREAASETGRIPAIRVNTAGQKAESFLPRLLQTLQTHGFRGPSLARQELQRRSDRSPRQVARQLSRHYGHDLKPVVYIPAMALVGRLRLGQLTDDASHAADVQQIVAPYFAGEVDATPTNGSGLSGHLVFAELASRSDGTTRSTYIGLARKAADLAFDSDGLMPYHNEMSDALFMGGPILAHVGALTGNSRYYDACIKHLRGMRELVLRDDGLYRHSPLDEAAWGRGNGFPALGLAWCLTHWPADRGDQDELLDMFRRHMSTLIAHQDEMGCWHQVIDHPHTYRELSCTCMITVAMARGVRLGWLEAETYRPVIERAWYAIRSRVAADGRLVDVCTGTGKQDTLADYYHRPAILGPDSRGGAMALLAATEMAAYQQ